VQIALTSPYGYPEVARGAERYCSELSTWLAGRGHDVTWLYTARDPSAAPTHHGPVAVEVSAARAPRGAGRWERDALVQAGRALHTAVRGRQLDVVQCHHHVDATALRLTRSHPPYVIWVPGVARRAIVRRRVLHVLSARVAMGGAARIHSLSRYAQAALRDELGVASEVVPPGVDVARYAGERPVATHPVVLCTAAVDDPRKNVALLVQAFARLLRDLPDAELVIANQHPAAATRLRDDLDAPVRARVTVAAGLDFDALAALYRAATVSVLPSVDEAFGLVMVESLAAGTPVVGTAHGAIPEVLDDDRVSRLFPPGDLEALVGALRGALELSGEAATAALCRAHAQRWSWSSVGPMLEAIYGDLAA